MDIPSPVKRLVYRRIRAFDASSGAPVSELSAKKLRLTSADGLKLDPETLGLRIKRREASSVIAVVLGMDDPTPASRRFTRALLLSLCGNLKMDDRLMITFRTERGWGTLPLAEIAAYRLRAALPQLEQAFLAQASEEEKQSYLSMSAGDRAVTWMSQLPEELPDSAVLPYLTQQFDALLADVVPADDLDSGLALTMAKLGPASDGNLGLLMVVDPDRAKGPPVSAGVKSLKSFRSQFLLPTWELAAGRAVRQVMPNGRTVVPLRSEGVDGVVRLMASALGGVHELSFVTTNPTLVDRKLEIAYAGSMRTALQVEHPPSNRLPREMLLTALARLGPGPENEQARKDLLDALKVHRDPEVAGLVRGGRAQGSR
ncbi:MAG: hypothetical protein AAF533_14075 [Acidobacteriota bacterium]